ncbi:LOW QUALITY PROTEIN: hypothetical protein CRUP_017180, partial [Coryphaenoides rupestris]
VGGGGAEGAKGAWRGRGGVAGRRIQWRWWRKKEKEEVEEELLLLLLLVGASRSLTFSDLLCRRASDLRLGWRTADERCSGRGTNCDSMEFPDVPASPNVTGEGGGGAEQAGIYSSSSFFFNTSSSSITTITASTSCRPAAVEVDRQALLVALAPRPVRGGGGGRQRARHPVRGRRLQTPTNLFIVNLAAADLLLGAAVLPFSAAMEVLGGCWPFGRVWCDVWAAVDVLCCTASILSLCVISVDRYVGVAHCLHYPRLVTGRRAAAEAPPRDPRVCRITEEPLYALLSSLCSFYAPLAVILLMYARVYVVLPGEEGAKTLAIVVGLFILCWLPFFFLLPLGPPTRSSRWSFWLGYFNSCINPIIYPCSSQEFKRAFIRLLRCQCQRRRRRRRVLRRFYDQHWRTTAVRGGTGADRRGLEYGPPPPPPPLPPPCTSSLFPALKPSDTLFKVVFWLGYFNSCINPIIYPCSSQEFKRAFIRLLRCQCQRRRRRRRVLRRFYDQHWRTTAVRGGTGADRRGLEYGPPPAAAAAAAALHQSAGGGDGEAGSSLRFKGWSVFPPLQSSSFQLREKMNGLPAPHRTDIDTVSLGMYGECETGGYQIYDFTDCYDLKETDI